MLLQLQLLLELYIVIWLAVNADVVPATPITIIVGATVLLLDLLLMLISFLILRLLLLQLTIGAAPVAPVVFWVWCCSYFKWWCSPWLHKVLLQLQFSSHTAIVGSAPTANDSARSAVGAAPAAIGAAPAEVGAAQAANGAAQSALGDFYCKWCCSVCSWCCSSCKWCCSSFSCCFLSINGCWPGCSWCYFISSCCVSNFKCFLHQPLLHYYAAVTSALVATVSVDTARRFQPPLLWRCCRSHRKKISNIDRKFPPSCVIRIKTLPLLPRPAAVILRANYPHHIFPTACSSATVGRDIYLPPSPLPLYLYLWLRILRCISYDAIRIFTTYSALREKSNKCKYLFLWTYFEEYIRGKLLCTFKEFPKGSNGD